MTQAPHFEGRSVLAVNVPTGSDAQRLVDELGAERLDLHATDAVYRDEVRGALPGVDVSFGTAPAAGERWAVILLYLPKGKERLRWLARSLGTSLEPGGELLVVGGNSEGIKSVAGQLEAFYGTVRKIESARHCRLISAMEPRDTDVPLVDERWTLERGEGRIVVADVPGVFSAGGLDAGSALLLEHLPENAPGRVLDVGSGSGVLSAIAALRWPEARISAADSDAFAVEATRRTLATIDPEGTRTAVYASDLYADVPGRFDLIVSNPPFHRGTATEYATGERLVREAHRKLDVGGEIRIVYNRFLKIGDWLEEVFRRVDELADDGRFRVVRAKGPIPAHRRAKP